MAGVQMRGAYRGRQCSPGYVVQAQEGGVEGPGVAEFIRVGGCMKDVDWGDCGVRAVQHAELLDGVAPHGHLQQSPKDVVVGG